MVWGTSCRLQSLLLLALQGPPSPAQQPGRGVPEFSAPLHPIRTPAVCSWSGLGGHPGHMWPCRSQGQWGTAGWRASGVLLRKRESEGPGAPLLGSESWGHGPCPAGHRDGVRHLQLWHVTESVVDDLGKGWEQAAHSAQAWKAGQRRALQRGWARAATWLGRRRRGTRRTASRRRPV